jgi:hypothetical protein
MTCMMPVHASNMPCLFILILKSCCLCCYIFIVNCSVIIHVPGLYDSYALCSHVPYFHGYI